VDTYEYYQFINTVEIEEFAPDAYHFYGVLNGEIVRGAYITSHGIVAFSDNMDWDDNTMSNIKTIVEEKIEEQKEEELEEEEKI